MNNVIDKSKVWVIMSKDRKLIAKGTPRNRELVRVDDKKDKKRYLTYSSKGRAEAGFKGNGFYGMGQIEGWDLGAQLSDYLEAVEVERTMVEVLPVDKVEEEIELMEIALNKAAQAITKKDYETATETENRKIIDVIDNVAGMMVEFHENLVSYQ